MYFAVSLFLFCRELIVFCRELILFCRELIVFCRELILFCREFILFCRELILFCRDVSFDCKFILLCRELKCVLPWLFVSPLHLWATVQRDKHCKECLLFLHSSMKHQRSITARTMELIGLQWKEWQYTTSIKRKDDVLFFPLPIHSLLKGSPTVLKVFTFILARRQTLLYSSQLLFLLPFPWDPARALTWSPIFSHPQKTLK